MSSPSLSSELVSLAAQALCSIAVVLVAKRIMDPHREERKRARRQMQALIDRLRAGRVDGCSLHADNFSEHEQMVATEVVNPAQIGVTYAMIGGQEELIQEVQEAVIVPLQRQELFRHSKLLRPPKGILLYGPPGTGKTMLAKAIAKEAGFSFFNLNFSTLSSKWYGESQKLAAAVFSLAHKLAPSILFVDEIDCLFRVRSDADHEATNNLKAEFMSLWDGLLTDENVPIMVIGATNRPDAVDPAILRRLPRTFHVGLPSKTQRKAMLQMLLQGEPVEESFDFDAVAAATDGYSGSDLKELCKCAAMYPVREMLRREREQQQSQAAEGGAAGGEAAGPLAMRPMCVQDCLNAKTSVMATVGRFAAYQYSMPGPMADTESFHENE